MNHWAEAEQGWLDSRRSPHTRRGYGVVFGVFRREVDKPLDRVSRADVAAYLEALRRRGRAMATLAFHAAVISSFYSFASEYLIPDDNEMKPLAAMNPAAGLTRRFSMAPYGHAGYLTVEQVRALLAAPDREAVRGARDYALLLFFVATGRRNTEVRQLRWGDLSRESGRIYYQWAGKGKERRDELPRVAYQAIVAWLEKAGRMPPAPNDYIFTTSGEAARPISARGLQQIVKRMARQAGLAESVHPHTLRHTAAMLRRAVGDDVLDVSKFLNHSNISTTQIYLDHVEGRADLSWPKVQKLIGIA